MEVSDIKNVAVFLNLGGETVGVKIPSDMKIALALFAISLSKPDMATIIPVHHLTLPADPEVNP